MWHLNIERYDEKHARQHIKRVRELLTTPQVLTAGSEPAALQIPAAAAGEEQKEGTQLTDYEERLKKNYEDFMAIVERESKKEIPMPPINKTQKGA